MPSSKKFIKNPDFFPTDGFHNRWLYTRKKEMRYGHFELPGLYRTYLYPLDFVLFFLAIVCEFWGLINLINVMNLYLGYKVSIVAGGILLDLLFAIGAHWNHGKICKSTNTIKLLEAKLTDKTIKGQDTLNHAGQIRKWKNRIIWWEIVSWIFRAMIAILALTKILFFKANAPIGNQLVFVIIITYVLVAIIHMFFTGYFAAEWSLKVFFFNKQFKQFKDHTNEYRVGHQRHILGHADWYNIPTGVVITPYNDNTDINVSKQHQIKVENTKFQLLTYGLLIDEELNTLITHQSDQDKSAKEMIGLLGLKRQMDMLNL